MSFTAVNARRAGWIFLAGTVLVCGLAITARSLWIDEIEIARRAQQPPRWLQRSGLEWFYRLGCEPRRLGKRYLKNNPLFVLKIAGQLSGLKKYPLEQD